MFDSDTPHAPDFIRNARVLVERVLRENPEATIDDVNAALAAATTAYNLRPQAELGGLSPAAVHALLGADWESDGSAVVLDDTLGLEELRDSLTLHNARLLMELVEEPGGVKATSAGNLPRAVVSAFLRGMRWPPDEIPEWFEGKAAIPEQELFPLHRLRVLLDLAGILKRRKGVFRLTARGRELRAPERAGRLVATLFRTHFRVLNLAWLDGIGPAPAFQQTIAFTLYRFGQLPPEWRRPGELAAALLLPAVHDELNAALERDFELPLMMETRLLRPLEGFGLAESREMERRPEELGRKLEFRRTPLFRRFLRFQLWAVG
jgi:hypothetical protein